MVSIQQTESGLGERSPVSTGFTLLLAEVEVGPPDSIGQSGATQQISDTSIADSESVEELAGEGNTLEANDKYGVENARDPGVSEVISHERDRPQRHKAQSTLRKSRPLLPFIFAKTRILS